MKPRRAILACLLTLAACAYHPARFAHQLPVTEVHDDKPIPVPEKRAFIEDLYQADVYVRRELTNGLDPRRIPEALDANSVDEVPTSSWFRGTPEAGKLLDGYERDGPPVPPFQLSLDEPSSGTPNAIVITDARGLAYELLHDAEGREGTRTGAAAIASRLFFALGYRTPEVHVITSHEGKRAAATRWPPGIDLGPTPIARTRPDDPNDYVEHVDRRTLRALFHVTAWLDMRRLKPRMLRDVYVGKRGKGHVQHQIVGVDGALGAQNYDDAVDWANDPDREDSNFFLRVFSLGLSPKPVGLVPKTEFPSVGIMSDKFLPDEWDMSPPFEPTDRVLPGDSYWTIKRISNVDARTIDLALRAAKLPKGPTEWLRERIARRRSALVAHGYSRTAPCEVSHIAEATKKRHAQLKIVDRGVFQGFTPTAQRSYLVRIIDDQGETLMPNRGIAATGALTDVALPPALAEHDYFVVRMWAHHGTKRTRRPVEAHVRTVQGQFRLVGVRH